jgi:hypothetical protein
MTLDGFLAARLDEREAAAKAATPGPWRAVGEDILSGTDDPHWAGACAANASGADAAHIALNDPAHVLREVEAGRKILVIARIATEETKELLRANPGATAENPDAASAAAIMTTIGLVLVALAEAWSDHPAYDEAWRP